MNDSVYTVNEVAKLFKTSTTSVYTTRNEGKLKQLKDVPGIKFSAKEVHALMELDDEYSPIGYRKLKKEVERLEEENRKLKNGIKKITSQMLVIVGEELQC